MKFAQIALLGLVSVQAVHLTKGQKGPGGPPPTPADIIAHCDQSGNGMLSKDEVHACVNEMVPSPDNEAVNDMIDEHWAMIAGDDKEIDEDELSRMMGGGPNGLAQNPNEPTAKDVMDYCDHSGNGMLDKQEVHACIREMVGPPHDKEINDMIDEYWVYIAGDDKEIDLRELRQMMGAGPNGLAQRK